MNAYDIMHEWDRATGNDPRSDEDLDRDIPATLVGYEYQDWKTRLEAHEVAAITAGMRLWGLPIAPLGGFEMDAYIGNVERPDSPAE